MVQPNYYNVLDWTIQTHEVIWYHFTQWNDIIWLHGYHFYSHWYPHIISNKYVYSCQEISGLCFEVLEKDRKQGIAFICLILNVFIMGSRSAQWDEISCDKKTNTVDFWEKNRRLSIRLLYLTHLTKIDHSEGF